MTEHSAEKTLFTSKRYTDWQVMTEDINAGKLDATFLLAPLAMVLARQGTSAVKIVHLGHRDGTALVVPTDSTYRSFADLKGKRIAVPHRFSNQKILVSRLMDEYGFAEDDVTTIDYPPPEMPAALRAGAFDAYIVGEPFAAKAEKDGFGRILAFTKDVWPNFISCVLVVTQKLIDTEPELVRELVQGITASGHWIDEGDDRLLAGVVTEQDAPPEGTRERSRVVVVPDSFGRTPRMQAALIAARREYFSQDPELLKWVLTRPVDRVRYTQLELAEEDFAEIQRYAERLGYFSFRPVTDADPFGFADYCDPSFERSGVWELPIQEK